MESEDPIFAAEEARKSGKGSEKGEERRGILVKGQICWSSKGRALKTSEGWARGMSLTSNEARDERDERRVYAPPLTQRRGLKPGLNTWLAEETRQ
ncbi:hypothetical protein BHE74_00026777 [Ensete ventricosum]|nr:hypothetical protein GW17_00045966 [Ensete ventricosum]RWW65890.1 hypothetical protein BHE74_00026777 [Ensete ventricosum]RZR99817.1 hypothetical protein BHM03_00029440 [Ensete ventricosum]